MGHAHAANSSKPRAAVLWSSSACVQVVDRSKTPSLQLDYGVSQEELVDGAMRTPDEVDDSRTLQFFAFRSQRYEHAPPGWITQADIDRAAMKDPMVHPADIDPLEILAGGPVFGADEWVRITADDARVPINNAQAAMGISWDLRDVPPGSWMVWGYTWEPIGNLWSPRWGAVKIVEGAALAADAGPVIMLLPNEQIVAAGEPYVPKGCVDAPTGSTLTIEWGQVLGTVEPEWEPLVRDVPVENGEIDIAVEFPAEAAMHNVHLRATVVDPSGKSYTAFTSKQLSVMPGEDDGGGGGCRVAARQSQLIWLLALGMLPRRRRPVNRKTRVLRGLAGSC